MKARLRCRSAIPLISVLNNPANATFGLTAAYTNAALESIARYAVGISPDKTLLAPNNGLNYTQQPTSELPC